MVFVKPMCFFVVPQVKGSLMILSLRGACWWGAQGWGMECGGCCLADVVGVGGGRCVFFFFCCCVLGRGLLGGGVCAGGRAWHEQGS